MTENSVRFQRQVDASKQVRLARDVLASDQLEAVQARLQVPTPLKSLDTFTFYRLD